MQSVNAYLMFNGNAEEAFTFYQSVFGGELQLVRFGDMEGGADAPPEAKDRIAHVSLPLNGKDHVLMGSDCFPGSTVDVSAQPNFNVCLAPSSREETERIFEALGAGGNVTMPLAKTEWTDLFGMVVDKFSIPWMIDYSSAA